MALLSGTGFILRLDPVSEKDLAVSVLVRGRGVLRGVVRGARGNTRKAAALQLLTEVALTIYRREGADLARFDAIEIVRSAFALAGRGDTAMLLPYMAESLLTFVPDSDPGDEVYRLTRHVLDALLDGADPDLAARYFEIWMLRFAGLLPELSEIPEAARPVAAASLRRPLPEAGPFGRTDLAAAEALCRSLRRDFLGHELKSYRFLDLV
jgi:DNA repair protein RecO